eukprot:403361182
MQQQSLPLPKSNEPKLEGSKQQQDIQHPQKYQQQQFTSNEPNVEESKGVSSNVQKQKQGSKTYQKTSEDKMKKIISSTPYVTLNNGIKMPQFGLGTYRATEGVAEICKRAISEEGYRAIDTATKYDNEADVGQAIRECLDQGVVKREELFITTKLWKSDFADPEKALRTSLEKLQIDYVDLYLIHWMIPDLRTNEKGEIDFLKVPLHKVWKDMESLVKKGLAKSIGVSNCLVPQLLDILTYCEIKPVLNQIEIHPYFNQQEAIDFHRKLNVHVEAYAPLGNKEFEHRGTKKNLLEDNTIKQIAEKYNRTPAQIILNWHLQRGVIVITKTSKGRRLSENIDIFDFKLDQSDMDQINSLNIDARLFDPLRMDKSGFENVPYFN